jgi:galactokinase
MSIQQITNRIKHGDGTAPQPLMKHEGSTSPSCDDASSAVCLYHDIDHQNPVGLDDDIHAIMRQIQNETWDDEKQEKEAMKQLADAQRTLELLEARKKRRNDDLGYLLAHRYQDCEDWSKKLKF